MSYQNREMALVANEDHSEDPGNRDATESDLDSTALEPKYTFTDGASFILDRPEGTPAIWGHGNEVLWAKGEALMIAGPQGLGKTTLAGQLLRAMIGVGTPEVLGLPVMTGGKVLYLAMDRPAQIARAHGRAFTAEDRDLLSERLIIHRGPPPYDLAKNTDVLANMCLAAGAQAVVVDSLKDAALGLSEDEVGAGYNRARQTALAAGVQVLELHHTTKRGANGNPIGDIGDVYGSTWLTSGSGSVILLTGNPGDPIIGMKHLKQPSDEVGPYRLNHDQAAGTMSISHGTDLVDLVRGAGPGGLSTKAAASAIFETERPTRNDIEKARRRLSKLADDNLLIAQERTTPGGGKAQTAWFLAMRAAS